MGTAGSRVLQRSENRAGGLYRKQGGGGGGGLEHGGRRYREEK
jgi:hypothetical protein